MQSSGHAVGGPNRPSDTTHAQHHTGETSDATRGVLQWVGGRSDSHPCFSAVHASAHAGRG